MLHKDLLETKRTKQSHGNFTSISGHFSSNYSKIFHKTEVLMNISGSQACLNLNWFKSYNIKQNFVLIQFFQFCKKKKSNLQLINGHFTTISNHFSDNFTTIFHKTEVQKVILRCLEYLCLNWIKRS